jgi:hypothetical protein
MDFDKPQQRIDDPARTEKIASAGKLARERAANLRIPNEGGGGDREYMEALARREEKWAAKYEKEAGEEYDEHKRLEGMSYDDLYAELIRLKSVTHEKHDPYPENIVEKNIITIRAIERILSERVDEIRRDNK